MAGEKKFFLGIGGQQTGPFAEDEVNSKIQAGEAKGDALIWYEGLAEWQRVDTIAFFQGAFKKSGAAAPAVQSSPAAQKMDKPAATTATGSKPPVLEPIFSSREAVFFRRRGPRPQMVVAVVGALALGAGLYWYLDVGDEEFEVLRRPAAGGVSSNLRFNRLRKADSDYLLNPTVIPEDFSKLITENSTDEVGVKAIEQLEQIYKKKHRNRELADLYLRVGRPADAVAYFLEEKAFTEAQMAAFQGYEKATDKVRRRKLLTTSIEILTGPLKDLSTATTRIQILEKEFPSEPNPYSYYLLSEEKKMADLFNRTSYFFVEGLINHMKAEFPQLKLAERPTVSVVREAGKYRLAGSYKGDVILSKDRLSKIRFEYWLVNNEWNLVATNVTKERQEWARANRSRQAGTAQLGGGLLAYLENMVRAQFPKSGLHEKIPREAMIAAARENASAAQ